MRKSWHLEDSGTSITINLDTTRKPRSQTGGKFEPAAKVPQLVAAINEAVNAIERQ